MSRIDKILYAICATVSGLCMIGMIGFNFADSIGRQLSKPVLGAQESVSFLLVIFFFASVPILIREDAHIRVGLFVELYPRAMAALERIFTALAEVFCTGLLIWLVYDRGVRLEKLGSLSSHHKVPLYIFLYAGAVLMLCSAIFLAQRYIAHRAGSQRPETPKGAHAIPHNED